MKNYRENQLLSKIKIDLTQKNYDDAQKGLQEILKINPENSEAYFLLADMANQKGQIGKGIKYFKKVLSLNPENTDAAIALSVLYNDIGKYKEAKILFDQVAYRIHNQTEEALKGDTHINRQFASKHFELAELYLTYERYEEALYEYSKVLKLMPEHNEARVQIGKTYSKQGLMAKAFQELRNLKNDCPSFLPGRIALGILYYGNGSILEAQNEWQKVLSKDSQNPEALMYMKISQQATETKIDL